MKTQSISFRLEIGGAAHDIFTRHKSLGEETRDIFENALLALDGREREQGVEIGVHDFKRVVGLLENIADTINSSVSVATAQRREPDDALGNEFIAGMRQVARPGFRRQSR